MVKIILKVDRDHHYHLNKIDNNNNKITTEEGNDIVSELTSILNIGSFNETIFDISHPPVLIEIVVEESGDAYFKSCIPFTDNEIEKLQNAIYTIIYGIISWHGLDITWDCEPPKSLDEHNNNQH